MKVALAQAPVWWTLDAPLGLAQMAGAAKSGGHEVSVFDLNIRLWKEGGKAYESLWQWEQFHFWNKPEFVKKFFGDMAPAIGRMAEEILRSDARVVAFSVHSGTQLATIELARLVKSGDPGRKVVLGGQYFFFGDKIEETLLDPAVDAVIQGAGDMAFPAFLASLEASGEIPSLPGVWTKRGGKAVSGGEPEPIRDMDAIPFADFTGLPLDLYTDSARLPFAASRGCVWQCRFCSARAFWKGYSYMSGRRIFAEISHHKKLFPGRSHFEFHDITANGNVRELHDFAKRAADFILESPRNFFGWKINAILRPEMTPEVLRDLRRANCHDIIYGLESGSPRVVKLMNKGYTHEIAQRVLRDTHEAGIATTINVMFGFPGETEEDFQMTLDFIKRNRGSLDRVYGSATFTSLEERSYLIGHQKEMGIKEMPADRFHNLFWESEDGSNTYPVRLDRYNRFRKLVLSLGLDAYKGINGSLEQNTFSSLAEYHHFVGRPLSAVVNRLDYLEHDPYHEPTRGALKLDLPVLQALADAQRALDKGDLPRAQARAARAGGGARLVEENGSARLFWREEAVHAAGVKDLYKRTKLIVELLDSEVRRGEDKKPEPICAR